jgi:uroporphyrin-III C-methyltransferase/precorrin-2 dehydrogenase/sirohydrochlorin ferrochelatase
MDYLPIFLDLHRQPCAVVGGGEVAARKVALLLKAGAAVTVTAPELCAALTELVAAGRIVHRAVAFSPAALDGAVLAIAATNARAVNAEVSRLARARPIPVNVVDDPELCSFVMPAIVDRSPVIVAVSTGGASPVLARLLRARLETLIPASFGALARLADRFRERVKAALPAKKRRVFWESVLQGPVADLVFSGREHAAETAFAAALKQGAEITASGEVYLVGAGPGHPDLLTFAALRLMQQADVVLHDNLVAPAILDLVRRDAERIYVGKRRAQHALRQEEINALMVRLAQEGKRVLRLKGGDPYTFGRGGEEIETLAAHGIRFQVVPGVTAAAGVAAYAGIPLTHRDYAHACLFVTGHLHDDALDMDWTALTRPQQTLVVYMGLAGIDALCAGLLAHGLPASTPAAIVSRGTQADQRTVVASVGTLAQAAHAAQLPAPTLIIVGDVVRLHDKLDWYGAR